MLPGQRAHPSLSTHTTFSAQSRSPGGPWSFLFSSRCPQFITQLPLLRVRLNLLHDDVGIQHPQEDPNLADEHPLQPLSQLADIDIQDDLHQVVLPGIWKARGSVMALEVGECVGTGEKVTRASEMQLPFKWKGAIMNS